MYVRMYVYVCLIAQRRNERSIQYSSEQNTRKLLLSRTHPNTHAAPGTLRYLEHEVEGEGLGEGVLQGRLGPVLVQHLAQLVGAVGVRLPLNTEVLLALRLTR